VDEAGPGRQLVAENNSRLQNLKKRRTNSKQKRTVALKRMDEGISGYRGQPERIVFVEKRGGEGRKEDWALPRRKGLPGTRHITDSRVGHRRRVKKARQAGKTDGALRLLEER